MRVAQVPHSRRPTIYFRLSENNMEAILLRTRLESGFYSVHYQLLHRHRFKLVIPQANVKILPGLQRSIALPCARITG